MKKILIGLVRKTSLGWRVGLNQDGFWCRGSSIAQSHVEWLQQTNICKYLSKIRLVSRSVDPRLLDYGAGVPNWAFEGRATR